MRYVVAVLAGVALLAGCAGSNEKLKAAEEENRRLTAEVEELREARARLSGQVEHLDRLTSALGRENISNQESLLALRRGAREFVLAQIAALNEFAGQDQWLDFLGGELVARDQVEGEDLSLLDAGNPVPRGGALLGLWGEFTGPTSFRVVVVRPGEKDWVAAAEAGPFAVDSAGKARIRFEAPLEVEPGDLIAYVFEGPVSVPFDRGVGGVRFGEVKVELQKNVDLDSFAGEDERRAYSLGVAGALDRTPAPAVTEGERAAVQEPSVAENESSVSAVSEVSGAAGVPSGEPLAETEPVGDGSAAEPPAADAQGVPSKDAPPEAEVAESSPVGDTPVEDTLGGDSGGESSGGSK